MHGTDIIIVGVHEFRTMLQAQISCPDCNMASLIAPTTYWYANFQPLEVLLNRMLTGSPFSLFCHSMLSWLVLSLVKVVQCSTISVSVEIIPCHLLQFIFPNSSDKSASLQKCANWICLWAMCHGQMHNDGTIRSYKKKLYVLDNHMKTEWQQLHAQYTNTTDEIIQL